MGKKINSKIKGKAGERELAKKLREYGFEDAKRTQQYCGVAGDADLIGLDGIHIECKRVQRLNIHEAMRQATADAKGEMPAVFHRRNHAKWMVTMYLDDWIKIYKGEKNE